MSEQASTQTITITDDSGLLSLIDANAYATFVDEDWTLEKLLQHFNEQMAKQAALVWSCGDGGSDYRVAVRQGITQEKGFRETLGSIVVTGDRLHLVSYDALTMAAQFDDETLPSKYEMDAFICLKAGTYRVRIVQMFDPARVDLTPTPDFLIEFEAGTEPAWQTVAWF